MIRASFEGTALTLQGHAGAAPRGQDLVCAAVTGLTYALAQRLTELEKLGAFHKPPVIRLSSGEAQIAVVPKGEYDAQVQEDFHLIKSGLELLAQHYPEQIQLRDTKTERISYGIF